MCQITAGGGLSGLLVHARYYNFNGFFRNSEIEKNILATLSEI